MKVDLDRIVESFPGLVATMSLPGELDYLNQAVLDFFGKTAAELRSWAESDVIHPDDLPRVVSEFREAIAAGSPYTSAAHRCRRADGVYRWFQTRALPMRDADARIIGWSILLTEIDDLKRTEDALRASERSLRLIIDSIPTLAWSSRPDGSVEFFNQHYLDYVGLPAEQVLGFGWRTAFHPDDLERIADGWERIRASAQAGEHEGRLRRHDGEYRWFLFRLNPFRDESGNLVKWYGTSTDIDARRRAEDELRRSEAFLAEGQRLSSIGTFYWRRDTDEITFSEELYRILDWNRDLRVTRERAFQRILPRVHPEDLRLLSDGMARSLGTGGDQDLEIRLLDPDGSLKYLHILSRESRDLDGGIEQIGAVQDVTARRTSEEALGRARSELAHVVSAMSLGVLTASIAHEINQPLAGIVTNASTCLRMLAADPPDLAGARETARRTIRDGNRASDVIARLRALFSRKEPTSDPVDMNDATREVIALSSRELQRNRVILQSDLASDLPIVSGDRVQLQQVILNLVRNASEAMAAVEDRPRQLLIRTEREDVDRVRVSVRDAGVGVARESMSKLFDAFYTTKSGGMGIGLSVSRSIVERHGGRLWAETNEGPGATFAFSIPAMRTL